MILSASVNTLTLKQYSSHVIAISRLERFCPNVSSWSVVRLISISQLTIFVQFWFIIIPLWVAKLLFSLLQAKMANIYTLVQTSGQNIPNLRPKCSMKSIPVLRPKRLKNHTLWGGTYLYRLYREYPPALSVYYVQCNILIRRQ